MQFKSRCGLLMLHRLNISREALIFAYYCKYNLHLSPGVIIVSLKFRWKIHAITIISFHDWNIIIVSLKFRWKIHAITIISFHDWNIFCFCSSKWRRRNIAVPESTSGTQSSETLHPVDSTVNRNIRHSPDVPMSVPTVYYENHSNTYEKANGEYDYIDVKDDIEQYEIVQNEENIRQRDVLSDNYEHIVVNHKEESKTYERLSFVQWNDVSIIVFFSLIAQDWTYSNDTQNWSHDRVQWVCHQLEFNF